MDEESQKIDAELLNVNYNAASNTPTVEEGRSNPIFNKDSENVSDSNVELTKICVSSNGIDNFNEVKEEITNKTNSGIKSPLLDQKLFEQEYKTLSGSSSKLIAKSEITDGDRIFKSEVLCLSETKEIGKNVNSEKEINILGNFNISSSSNCSPSSSSSVNNNKKEELCKLKDKVKEVTFFEKISSRSLDFNIADNMEETTVLEDSVSDKYSKIKNTNISSNEKEEVSRQIVQEPPLELIEENDNNVQNEKSHNNDKSMSTPSTLKVPQAHLDKKTLEHVKDCCNDIKLDDIKNNFYNYNIQDNVSQRNSSSNNIESKGITLENLIEDFSDEDKSSEVGLSDKLKFLNSSLSGGNQFTSKISGNTELKSESNVSSTLLTAENQPIELQLNLYSKNIQASNIAAKSTDSTSTDNDEFNLKSSHCTEEERNESHLEVLSETSDKKTNLSKTFANETDLEINTDAPIPEVSLCSDKLCSEQSQSKNAFTIMQEKEILENVVNLDQVVVNPDESHQQKNLLSEVRNSNESELVHKLPAPESRKNSESDIIASDSKSCETTYSEVSLPVVGLETKNTENSNSTFSADVENKKNETGELAPVNIKFTDQKIMSSEEADLNQDSLLSVSESSKQKNLNLVFTESKNISTKPKSSLLEPVANVTHSYLDEQKSDEKTILKLNKANKDILNKNNNFLPIEINLSESKTNTDEKNVLVLSDLSSKEQKNSKVECDFFKLSTEVLKDNQINENVPSQSQQETIQIKINSPKTQGNEQFEPGAIPIKDKTEAENVSVTVFENKYSTEEALKMENEVMNSPSKDKCEDFGNNFNTSKVFTNGDDENSGRIEHDMPEVMDTEMINCNELEHVDLSEKDKEIDRIGIENELHREKEVDSIGIELVDLEVKSEKTNKVILCDLLKIQKAEFSKALMNSDNQSKLLSVEEVVEEPSSCEEETITGDTSIHSVLDKEVDVCIIPDNPNSKQPVEFQDVCKRELRSSDVEKTRKSDKKVDQLSVSEQKKLLCQDGIRKTEGNESSKSRPVRNAAKLAGNKIKSLVLNDMAVEDQTSSVYSKKEGGIHINSDQSQKMCANCKEVKVWKFLMVQGHANKYLCSEICSDAFSNNYKIECEGPDIDATTGQYVRKCVECRSRVLLDENCLIWEVKDFCNEECLRKYQTKLGSNCVNCNGNVIDSSLGKYCVRFGYDLKQFCSSNCLEEYKKGMKVCSYCQKDISTGIEGFLAPVGGKGQFKDFCSQTCMEKYERMTGSVSVPEVIEECAVCSNSKPVRLEVELDGLTHKLCSEPCFAAFKFVNNINEAQCGMCKKYFDRSKTQNHVLFEDETPRIFCCKTCMNVYILANRKITPCSWCKVKKYNFDMIKKGIPSGQSFMLCSLSCLLMHQVSLSSTSPRRIKCDFCMSFAQTQYHLTMSDGSLRNFCSYTCVMSFQVNRKKSDFPVHRIGRHRSSLLAEFFAPSSHYNNRFSKQSLELISTTEQVNSPIPMGGPKRVSSRRSLGDHSCVPVISSVQSLASPTNSSSPSCGRSPVTRGDANISTVPQVISKSTTMTPIPAPPPQIYQQIITKPAPVKQMKNKSTLCKPYSHTKGVSCRPHPCMKETQTDQSLSRKFLIPIPVPIYVPAPMHMFASPFPVPVPFPLPIPVPIFIPTTRNSAKGIFKEIKRIQEKIPTDPFEAELLMMAEMVAGEKKQDPTDSESEEGNDGDDGGDGADGTFSPENVDASNAFGDDVLQIALKMASELEEPAVDMESVLTSNTITTTTQPTVDPNKVLYEQVNAISVNRGRKRSVRGGRHSSGGTPSKRGRRASGSVDVPLLAPSEPVPPPRIEVEKPDANMCLKYTFGVNAWRHWVMQKNAELEKVAMTNRKIKLFKPELLQLTADELNFSLCLFVKEVRKPNGTEYAPDTIYYLCLGIQQYLFENGRIDNIFTDSYYEKFTDCLDDVAKKFAALYNDSQYIVTRVEEEHLWESKQLGAHSPHVLLSTLMFFNTKHFNLVTVEEHMQLSFSHIMKHWKRNPNTPGVAKVPGSRNVLLRFYPPQSALEANSRKKKVYEQQENEENPLRCPVKLYEFYLSKCPESVKTRNDVFYLLPERSCVPDSPVWYSTMALGKEPLMKMLHRIKMVKEINIALLSC